MAQSKALGFFNFHITADKAMDFLLNNGFNFSDLMITSVKAGEKFGEIVEKATTSGSKEIAKELDHPTIIGFFKHLFKFEGKPISPSLPFINDRDGFILSVLTSDPEQKQLAIESLDNHGAYYVKEM